MMKKITGNRLNFDRHFGFILEGLEKAAAKADNATRACPHGSSKCSKQLIKGLCQAKNAVQVF